ncbi:MAG: ATP-binding cassette domain-containing protein [Alphaproteobacteria bacterium]|nr:ATP-binding cassette domain-containing protein [Alphaproteobacteria bacterium]
MPTASALQFSGIAKAYGPTRALGGLTFRAAAGEVIGLVGANGAGKSTLMRIVAGVTMPDAGTLEIGGAEIDFDSFSPEQARRLGIRIVHQELSLCDSLSVAENFYVEQPGRADLDPRWLRRYHRMARDSIQSIFPGHGIDVRRPVSDLTLPQRQMIEIARAACDPLLRVLILDEPTSSLDGLRSEQLACFIQDRAAAGVAVIFISHKLQEVMSIAARVLVLRNGILTSDTMTGAISVPQMVAAMAGEAGRELEQLHRETVTADTRILAQINSPWSAQPAELRAGQIVGLAGLEGSGQRECLRALYEAARGAGSPGLVCEAAASYVSGDRRAEGVFPLWNVLKNATIGIAAAKPGISILHEASEKRTAEPWLAAVRLPLERLESPIVDLSGGNQQKVLLARALMTGADVILLDDPTRGVDVQIKRDFYRLIRQAADTGKLVVWYSSETIEFVECDYVLLFHAGAIKCTLTGNDLTEDAIVDASFSDKDLPSAVSQTAAATSSSAFRVMPFLTAALMLAVIGLLNRNAVSLLGIDLLMTAAIPLALISLAQLFIVGGSEIDLGVGAFAGLVSVISATFLVTDPALGWLFLAFALAGYAGFGLLIQLREIPAIVVTLGASFVWLGIGYTLQPTPGGAAPDWLAALAAFSLFKVPASVLCLLAAGAAATALNMSRLGVVLRGFGANPQSMVQSGWSPLAAAASRYGFSGLFGLAAGLSMTAINTASDINAGSSYTLLSIAAVVIGGSALTGGRITPLGTLFGAISLSLVGSLLGLLNVSTDFNAVVQGGLLIGIICLRTILVRSAP